MEFITFACPDCKQPLKIPADKASYGVFDALVDKSESDVHALLNELAKTQPAPGSVQKKVVDFYNSWMDQPAIEKRGVEPLKADLDAIGKAKTKADIVKLMGNFDYSGPAGLYIYFAFVAGISVLALGMSCWSARTWLCIQMPGPRSAKPQHRERERLGARHQRVDLQVLVGPTRA